MTDYSATELLGVGASAIFVGSWVRGKMNSDDSEASNGGSSDDGGSGDNTPITDGGTDERTAEAVEALLAMEKRNNPGPDAEDASDSGTFTLASGEKAVIEITPPQGYDLRVERLYVDRRDGVEYAFEASGIRLSDTHQWNGNPARKVTQNDRIIMEVANPTTNEYTFDYEAEMWKEVA